MDLRKGGTGVESKSIAHPSRATHSPVHKRDLILNKAYEGKLGEPCFVTGIDIEDDTPEEGCASRGDVKKQAGKDMEAALQDSTKVRTPRWAKAVSPPLKPAASWQGPIMETA